MRAWFSVVSIIFVMGCATSAQHTPTQSGDFLDTYAATGGFRFGAPRRFSPLPDGRWLFLQSPADSNVQAVKAFDPKTGKVSRFVTRKELVEAAAPETEEEKARRERRRDIGGGIAGFTLAKDGQTLLFNIGGVPHLHTIGKPGARAFASQRPAYDPKLSPDGRSLAFVHKNTVWVQPTDASTPARALFAPHEDGISYGLAEFVAQEEMGRMHGYWWGPDSATLLVQKTDERMVDTWYIARPADPAKKPSPRRYPAVGTQNAAVGLIIAGPGERRKAVIWDRRLYPYLATVRWQGGPPLLVVQNRTQTEHAVLTVDVDTGATRTLHVETDAAWINLDQSFPRWVDDGSAYLWASERDGAWKIERRTPDGKPERWLTKSLPGYQRVEAWLDDGMVLAVSDPPTERHLFRYSFDGGAPVRLTDAPGVHYATFRKDGRAWMHTARTADGRHVLTLHEGDSTRDGPASLAVDPGLVPNLELMTVPCGVDECDAAVIRPREMNPDVEYPVLVYVYGGPHYKVVARDPRRYLRQQWVADQGFVVFMVDGHGTPSRGRAFERTIAGDVATPTVADQVAGVKTLLDRVDGVDPQRVGIYGWSFGGYLSSMCLLREPSVFKAAVSGAPVTDWRWYDTHYTERYMGLLENNEAGYDATSLVTHAASVKRPLMLVHGTIDDNVYPKHTLKFSDALFRAGVPHSVLYVPGYTHRVAGKTITRRRFELLVDFFKKNL